ncbi:MAG: RNA 2'-phosphotransferase [Oscillochloris sp.]|nr:RNA 2'-phosphotransferase [Oscillochloris sp.]
MKHQDDPGTQLSRRLSYHLRHRPDAIGISLEPGGWVDVETLLAALAAHGRAVTRAELAAVVATNDKQRFTFDETGTRIRANQGHSVAVDLELAPDIPPEVLYHGTVAAALPAILREGLRPMRRHHVHLSADQATAQVVGARRGKPIILLIDAAEMQAAGFTFYRSANGVWLVDHVPPVYLRQA